MKKLNQFILLFTTICSLNSSAQTIPSYVPTAGLVGWWPFNGNANDASTNANNGTVNGVSLTADRFGNLNNAYAFDGISNYITVPNSSSLNITGNQITIAMWVFQQNLNTDNFHKGISKGGWDLGNGYELLYRNTNITDSGAIQLSGAHGGLQQYYNINGENSTWFHLVGVFNNGVGSFYINGQYKSANFMGLTFTNFTSNSYPLLFGKRTAGQILSGYVKGKLDDIGIWNRALSACEVKKLYLSGLGLTLSTSSSTICLGESKILSASGATNYLWSTGATTSSITVTPTVNTIYTVTTTYSVGCTDMRTINVTVNPCTAITEYDDTQLLSIFPNPAKTQININTDITYTSLTIVNSIGQVMVKNEKTNVISIESLKHGVYFIQLVDKENKVIGIKKFIKE